MLCLGPACFLRRSASARRVAPEMSPVVPSKGVFYGPPPLAEPQLVAIKKPVVRAKTFQSRMDRMSPEVSGG